MTAQNLRLRTRITQMRFPAFPQVHRLKRDFLDVSLLMCESETFYSALFGVYMRFFIVHLNLVYGAPKTTAEICEFHLSNICNLNIKLYRF